MLSFIVIFVPQNNMMRLVLFQLYRKEKTTLSTPQSHTESKAAVTWVHFWFPAEGSFLLMLLKTEMDHQQK